MASFIFFLSIESNRMAKSKEEEKKHKFSTHKIPEIQFPNLQVSPGRGWLAGSVAGRINGTREQKEQL